MEILTDLNGVVKYADYEFLLFEDRVEAVTENGATIFVVCDMNESNSIVYNVDSVPNDWNGCNYVYSDGNFAPI
jgi:hypothetical protein